MVKFRKPNFDFDSINNNVSSSESNDSNVDKDSVNVSEDLNNDSSNGSNDYSGSEKDSDNVSTFKFRPIKLPFSSDGNSVVDDASTTVKSNNVVESNNNKSGVGNVDVSSSSNSNRTKSVESSDGSSDSRSSVAKSSHANNAGGSSVGAKSSVVDNEVDKKVSAVKSNSGNSGANKNSVVKEGLVNDSVSGDVFNPLLDDDSDDTVDESVSSFDRLSGAGGYSSSGSSWEDDFSDGVDDGFDSFDDDFFSEFADENSVSVGSDYVINTDAVSRGIQDRESYMDDVDDSDSETFVGFDNGDSSSRISDAIESNVKNDVSVSGSAVNDKSGVSVSGDVFNPLLDDDSDEVSVGSVVDSSSSSSNNDNSSDSYNPLLDDVDDSDYDGSLIVDEELSDSSSGVVADSGVNVSVARDAVVESTEFESLVSVDDAEKLSELKERRVASRVGDDVDAKVRDERKRRKSVKKRGPRSIDSDFKRKPVREVVVDEFGREVVSGVDDLDGSSLGVEDGLSNDSVIVDKGSSVDSSVRERYRYLSADGRVNVAELEFFKNLGGSRSSVLRSEDLVASLRSGSDGLGESESDRKSRVLLYEQALRGMDGLQRGKRSSFNAKDRETLMFLAMFRYATDAQLSRMFSCSVQTSYNRLKKLRSAGLVIDRKIYGARPIWFLTEAGLLLSGFDLPRVTESKLTFSMFPHQFTVNNTAANLWGANVNVLNLPDFPSRNRRDSKSGKMVFGEELVSELEIQSSFGKIKMFDKSEVYRPQLLAEIDKQFKAWERSGGVEFGVSPEQVLGNEYMWALMPPFNVRLAYHVPDLVVKRPRNADGSPESIAVEIEINNKSNASYEKTLNAYRADNRLYKKVIWVCKNVGPARKLEQIAKEIGLWQSGRIDIVPVITEDGVFKERDLWMI